MNMLKVLLVSSASLNPPYCEVTGMKAVYELQKELAKDVEMHLISTISADEKEGLENWVEEQREKYALNVHLLPLGSLARWRFIGPVWLQFRLLLKTIKLVRRNKIDIVHEYSSMPVYFLKAWIYKLFRRGLRVFHTLVVNNSSPLAHPRFGLKGRGVDALICPSQHLFEKLRGNRYKEARLRQIPFGVRTDLFEKAYDKDQLRQRYAVPSGKKVVLYIGLLDKRKGADVFLQTIPGVIRECPVAVFVFVSSPVHKGILYKHDEAKKEYQGWLDEAGDNLIFLEGKQDIPALMALADIFVYPIATMHGILSLPLTLLEAISSSKAIITSNIPPMSDLFRDGKNALMISPGDVPGCSRAICLLLGDDEGRRWIAGNAGELKEQFDLEGCSKKLLGEYFSSQL